MSRFRKALSERSSDLRGRRWVYIPYDQLNDGFGPLAREDPAELGIIMVESSWKAARRPYHKQKLALVVANQRQFALEQAARGVAVKHIAVNGPFRTGVEGAIRELGRVRVMRPAERELRVDLQPLVDAGQLEPIPHEGWLTSTELFRASHPNGPPWLMERFYRLARRSSGLLMEGTKPAGGKYNFDAENRAPWKAGKDPNPSTMPRFGNDPIKEEVCDLIEHAYTRHPGVLDPTALPTTAGDAEAVWSWAKRSCLPNFGRYEDAMSVQSSGLFHTRISPLLNLHRLLPARVVREAAELDVPLASREGFVRQILGWREFMRHVHEETDGFRNISLRPPVAPGPDGEPDMGAMPSALGADTPLPPAYWGVKSGLNCLDTVVRDVWREGWSHHITRLMILSNLATLLDVSPRELTDWFWVAYIDAYDWVVEPNVLGMGTYGIGGLFTTKPYVSAASYIRRMSDYCDGCRFEPGSTCPFGPLYWAFLERHRDLLESNSRMTMPYRTLRSRMKSGQMPDQEKFVQIRDALLRGEELQEPAGTMSLPGMDRRAD